MKKQSNVEYYKVWLRYYDDMEDTFKRKLIVKTKSYEKAWLCAIFERNKWRQNRRLHPYLSGVEIQEYPIDKGGKLYVV